MHAIVGAVVTAIGVFGIFILGGLGAAIIAVPIVLIGLALLVLSGTHGASPLAPVAGFIAVVSASREYTLVARWTDRQVQRGSIASRVLPYAIVFGCTGKWARAFGGAPWLSHRSSS